MTVFQCSIWCLISFVIGTFFGIIMISILAAGKDRY